MPKQNTLDEVDLEGALAITQAGTDRNQAGAARTLNANNDVVRPPDEQPPAPPQPPPTEPPKPKGALHHP